MHSRARAVAQIGNIALAALCLALALSFWPPIETQAATATDCISGLPADVATQLQPLIQALCEANQSGPQRANQRDLELLAEALALLALADPGYGYAYPLPSYSYPPPGAPAFAGLAPTPAVPQTEDGRAATVPAETSANQPADAAQAEAAQADAAQPDAAQTDAPLPDDVQPCASGPP